MKNIIRTNIEPMSKTNISNESYYGNIMSIKYSHGIGMSRNFSSKYCLTYKTPGGSSMAVCWEARIWNSRHQSFLTHLNF